MNKHDWMKKLKEEGFTDIRVCPIESGSDSGEHTHDKHTVAVILSGDITVIDKEGKKTYIPGDKVEFPAGTTHKAIGGAKRGSMIVGIKESN